MPEVSYAAYAFLRTVRTYIELFDPEDLPPPWRSASMVDLDVPPLDAADHLDLFAREMETQAESQSPVPAPADPSAR